MYVIINEVTINKYKVFAQPKLSTFFVTITVSFIKTSQPPISHTSHHHPALPNLSPTKGYDHRGASPLVNTYCLLFG